MRSPNPSDTPTAHAAGRRLPALVAAVLAVLVFLAAPAPALAGPEECLACHEKAVHAADYGRSAHKDLACTACHVRDQAAAAPTKDGCVASFPRTECARCHAKQVEEHRTSVHNGDRLPIPCARCHADIHAIQSHKGDKLAIAETCSGCHSRQQPYFESTHFEALKKGVKDAPTCTDCHGVHAIAKVDNDAAGRDFHTRACLKCHDDKAMMDRNKVTAIAGETYFTSFHGKNVHLGYPENVAGCADCHGSHGVLKADDPRSTVNKERLVETCRQCHAGASASFTGYIAHAEDGDRKKYPALYWTRTVMTGLLVGTFLFFWVHSLLWAFRAFVEKQQKARLPAGPAAETGAPEAQEGAPKLYRRFETKHIVLHLVVVVSFLALALTGLPLKFNGAEWSRSVMAAIGGPGRARLVHHAAAVVTFGYFAVALAMSARFLLSKRAGGGSMAGRLLGPDSLFPNLRDWRDLTGMVRWFFFAGPKPTFERWTYWEKFDFMAVFWGMFAIGSSGLMLWFPVRFARLLPGWMFNVATIIHSDEALLATGFIFTVHFFNTHFRPEKFPMDAVIFNGRITREEMLHERGDQWRRYEAEGRTEAFVVEKPSSIVWELAFRVFGLLAVAVGLSLAVGILYAMVHG